MKPDFSKYADGLVPVIVQDQYTQKVLMLGFMNEEALRITKEVGKVTFFSRTKKRLWTKGESSGNFLLLKEIITDCDNDTLLIKATSLGPVCHTGNDTCFNETNKGFSLSKLEETIASRKSDLKSGSYTSGLFSAGINKIAQKVGEEAIELVIESKDNDNDRFLNEAADLLFHYLVLLQHRNYELKDVINKLAEREK